MPGNRIIDNCKDLATRMHGRDTPPREGSGLPYISHPARVVDLLEQWGFGDEPLAIALGWTHDLKEDTKVTDDEIVTAGMEVGRQLLEMVNVMTFKDSGDDYDTAKAKYIAGVAEHGGIPLAVKIADRLCNSLERAETAPKRARSYLKKGTPLFEHSSTLPHHEAIEKSIAEVGNRLLGGQNGD